MMFPLFLAHGVEIIYAVLAWFVMTYGSSILCVWLAVKRKKVAAIVIGILALVVAIIFVIVARGFVAAPPLALSLIGLWIAFRIKKEPIQLPETTRGK